MLSRAVGAQEVGGEQGGTLPTFWLLMFFIINDSKKKLRFIIAYAKSL